MDLEAFGGAKGALGKRTQFQFLSQMIDFFSILSFTFSWGKISAFHISVKVE